MAESARTRRIGNFAVERGKQKLTTRSFEFRKTKRAKAHCSLSEFQKYGEQELTAHFWFLTGEQELTAVRTSLKSKSSLELKYSWRAKAHYSKNITGEPKLTAV